MKEETKVLVKKALEENFPNDTQEELNEKINSLKENEYEGESSLYVLEFRGIVLRVGIGCEETRQYSYFLTEAGIELEELLKMR